MPTDDEAPIVSRTRNRTLVVRAGDLVVRLRHGWASRLARWVRGLLVAGVAAGVLAAIRWVL